MAAASENNEEVIAELNNEFVVAEPGNEMVIVESNNEMVLVEPNNNDMVVAEPSHNEELKPSEMVVAVPSPNEMVVAEPSPNEMVVAEPSPNEMVVAEPCHNEMVVAQLSHNEAAEPSHNEMVVAEPSHNEMVVAELNHNEMVVAELNHNEMVVAELNHNEMVLEEPNNYEMVAVESNNEMVVAELSNEMIFEEPTPKSLEIQHDNSEPQPNKRRKKKSIVWEHFTIETVSPGCRRASCKQCKQSFAYSTGSKVAGTSHLKRHIAKGTCPVVLRNQGNTQSSPYSAPSKMGGNGNAPKRRYRSSSLPYLSFDPDRCRHEIARMMIMHDYPLHMVEHPGFVAFVHNLQPRFDLVSFNTVQGDCVATYLREKQSIQKVIEAMPGRVCLALDLWTSCQTVGYVFLTGYFIDNDWKMHRKLLNIVMEPYPESNTAFSHAVAACLSDWSVEGKLFSVTINQPLTESGIDNLRALLSVKNPLMLNGQLLVGDCLAHTLSNIAQHALRDVQDTVKKVRDCVKYVKASEAREEKFVELKQQLQVPSTKSLALDEPARWNTTYEMLFAASELKEVFPCLDTSDPDYKQPPSIVEWKQVETLCMYLKLLLDTANLIPSLNVPTTNTFFHEAWKIQLELARATTCEDPFISNLTKSMQEEFDRYWKSSCLILAIAVIMDPRFKMKLVEFSFSKIYGEDAAKYVEIVDEGIHELFLEYVSLPLPLTPTYAEEANGGIVIKQEDSQGSDAIVSNGLELTDFDMYMMETNSQQSRSELDQYLEESLLPRVHEFDVIGWWKLNRLKYPTLSKMARDILSVPVSTVAPDSVFDTTTKEMDQYRCSLRPETVEALICAKDWLQNETLITPGAPVKIEVPI